MKIKKTAAAIIAAMTAIAPLSLNTYVLTPTAVFAEETGDYTELPDWIPTDFETALEFRNTYGATHIQDGLVCLVFSEERECERNGGKKDEPHYSIYKTDGVMGQLKDDIYGTENSSSDYEVVVFKPLESGVFEISLIDNWVKSSSLESEFGYVRYLTYHTFSVDEDKFVTETDRFSWMPDCVTEYQDYVKKNGEVSVKDDLIVFCLDSAAGTPYTWQQMSTGFGDHAELYEYYDCSRETEIPLDGGTTHLMKVFKATNDGYVTIGLEYRDDLIGESDKPAERSLIADCVVLDDAKTVLLSGSVKVTLADHDTGEPIAYQHTSDSESGCLLFRECELDDDCFENPAIVDLETNPCVVNFKDLSKEHDYSFHLENADKALGNYTLMPDQTSVVRYDNNSYELVFRLRKSVSGDVNGDGAFNIADLVAFKRWLLGTHDAELVNWKAADLCSDGKLNVFDFCLMRRLLVKNYPELKNAPAIRDDYGKVTDEQRIALTDTLSKMYPGVDMSDFTFEYSPDHPLSYRFSDPCFYVYYKGVLVHGYGDLGETDNVFAAFDYKGNPIIELLIDPRKYEEIDVDPENMLSEEDAISEWMFSIHDVCKIIYFDHIHSSKEPDRYDAKIAYLLKSKNRDSEMIIDAVTGEEIEFIPYYVPDVD
ncbi:MAG: dockerin type I repeat-containing protein [Ruminococcus sp.]|nr:dockerin type I repeat-containing protein [Ruminococcus sp.]